MDLGNNPDFIAPGRRRKIEGGGHPYAGFSTGGMEGMASEQYQQVLQKLARYTGLTAEQIRRNPMSLQQLFQRALTGSMQVQQAHKEELEQAAVEVVLSLPEFATAREAVQSGDLKVIAELVAQVETQGMRAEPEEPDEDFRQQLSVPQIAQELEAEKQKRRLINAMIQGSAVNKNYAFHQVSDQLNAIDPGLLNQYGTLMAFAEFMYWAMPEDGQAQMYRSGAGAAGRVHLEADEEGVPTVRAQALVFPVLIQELAKGLMEFLSHTGDEDDPETRRHVQGQADTLADEGWDINIGAPLWRRLLRAIGNENQDLMPYVYDQLVRLPAGQFQELMRGVADQDPRALAQINQIVRSIRNEMQESAALQQPARRVLQDLLD